jgi:hypothetical protein
MTREEIVARGRALIGVRFRPQGRSADFGLDCIGVAAMALAVPIKEVRRDYRLRSNDQDALDRELAGRGFIRIDPIRAGPGDLLLLRTGPMSLHTVILTDSGYLHADLRLRRTVEAAGSVPWPILSSWRHPDVQCAGREPDCAMLSGCELT